MKLTPWQRLRTRAFLFAIGVKRRITLGVRVMLIRGDDIFLIRQTYLPGWQLPGGGVEPGETAEDSAARELLEESGYRVLGPMEMFGLYHNSNAMTDRDHVVLYVCRSFETAFDFKPNLEIAEFGWFDRNQLPEGVTDGTRQRVAEVFDGLARQASWGRRG